MDTPRVPDRIVRPRELEERLSVSKLTVRRMVERGELPPPLKISRGVVGWRESVIEQWLAEREDEAEQRAAQRAASDRAAAV
jgi:prophage regulatory protein